MGAPGFPLFFELNKQVGCLLFLLIFVYFLPLMVFWMRAYEPMAGKTDDIVTYSIIGLFSTGIFTYDPVTPVGIRFFPFEDRKQYLYEVGLLSAIMCGIMLLGFVIVRRNMIKVGL